MIEELVQETVEILEEEFYSKTFYFSYSSISKLLYSPAVFYQMYILGHRPETREQHLLTGSVIHCLLLEPHEFDNRYIVSPTNLPKDPSKSIIDSVYRKNKKAISFDNTIELDTLEYSILETLMDINLHQSLKQDSARLDKVITEQNKSYFEFLKNKNNKELLDEETFIYCKEAIDIIKSTPGVPKLLGMGVTPEDNIEVFNELYLEGQFPGKVYGIKGILDNLVINHDEKIIYINDFKTSSKSLDKFEESIEFWNYWMQAVIYIDLVGINYMNLIMKGYQIKFCFLVIDKYFNVYPFHLSADTALKWNNRLLKVFDDLDYHYLKNDYTLPAKYAQGLVKL